MPFYVLDETLSTLPQVGCRKAKQMQVLRHGDLRHEAAAILLENRCQFVFLAAYAGGKTN
jgi:hypothetical protein